MNYVLVAGYCLTVVALIATPGPVVLLVTGTAAREGYARAVRTMVGGNLASLLLIAVAAAMLTGALHLDPQALALVAIGGSLYIAFLAIGMLRATSAAHPAARRSGGLAVGFITALANPKDILFFVAFFPQFIHITADTGVSLGILTALWVVIDLSVLSLYILAIHRWLTLAHTRRLTTISAAFLLALALYGFGYNLWQLIGSRV
ncbi:lysine transporter LysE [Enterobacter sp. 10-1]|uniref:LysE family translocator n=1 Tax=Raoultella TaxID=160674 RepID=UPI000BA3F2AD|nr:MULTISPECIES: LysE family translocator [Enterobacteriaceae]MVT05073.1 LysE family transporter [Raoultella sp. 10-1]PAC09070.1 lysine transporter LysE [Enterobacter sp. 10-1]